MSAQPSEPSVRPQRVVFKYNFGTEPARSVPWPVGARVVHVAAQRPDDVLPTLWIEYAADQLAEKMPERRFWCIGTGHAIGDEELAHVGSAVCADGSLVWHVYAEAAL